MSIKDRDQLRINGYSVDAAGNIETLRESEPSTAGGPVTSRSRYAHEHCGFIRLDTGDSKFAARVVAAIDEPAIVGTSRTGALMLFKIGPTYLVNARAGYERPQAEHSFVHDGKAGILTVTTGGLVAVSDWSWKDGRSPLTTRHDELPILFPDVSQRAYDAVGALLREAGGRWGQLVIPESDFDRHVREIAAARAAGIPEPLVDDDERIVAANPQLGSHDGVFGSLISLARKRIAERKAAAP
jgi:hypothetical protein